MSIRYPDQNRNDQHDADSKLQGYTFEGCNRCPCGGDTQRYRWTEQQALERGESMLVELATWTDLHEHELRNMSAWVAWGFRTPRVIFVEVAYKHMRRIREIDVEDWANETFRVHETIMSRVADMRREEAYLATRLPATDPVTPWLEWE